MRSLLILLMFMLSANYAIAEENLTLLQLHSICDSKEQISQSACSGLFVGIVVGLRMAESSNVDGKSICLPDSFSPVQLKLILDKIVREGPQFLSLPAAPGLMVPLQAAYPCS